MNMKFTLPPVISPEPDTMFLGRPYMAYVGLVSAAFSVLSLFDVLELTPSQYGALFGLLGALLFFASSRHGTSIERNTKLLDASIPSVEVIEQSAQMASEAANLAVSIKSSMDRRDQTDRRAPEPELSPIVPPNKVTFQEDPMTLPRRRDRIDENFTDELLNTDEGDAPLDAPDAPDDAPEAEAEDINAPDPDAVEEAPGRPRYAI